MRPPPPEAEQLRRAAQERQTGYGKPIRERKPVFDLDSLTRANMAGDGMAALVKVGGEIEAVKTEGRKLTALEAVRFWSGRGAGVREMCRILSLRPADVQDHLTTIAREQQPLAAETRDALQQRLSDQLDWQRTSLQKMADDEDLSAKDRTAAHRALLLLAKTQADIAGLHRTQDSELARSIDALLQHDGAQRVALAIEYAHEDDRRHASEGERLHRSEMAATAKHYRPHNATIPSIDATADDTDQ